MSNGKSKESHHGWQGPLCSFRVCVGGGSAQRCHDTGSFDTDVYLYHMVDNMQRIVDIVARLCFVNATAAGSSIYTSQARGDHLRVGAP